MTDSTTRPPRTAGRWFFHAHGSECDPVCVLERLAKGTWLPAEAAAPDAGLREAATAVVKAWDKVPGRYDELLGPVISELKHRLAAHRSSDPSPEPVTWENCGGRCDCHSTICAQCGCTNEWPEEGAAPAGSAVPEHNALYEYQQNVRSKAERVRMRQVAYDALSSDADDDLYRLADKIVDALMAEPE